MSGVKSCTEPVDHTYTLEVRDNNSGATGCVILATAKHVAGWFLAQDAEVQAEVLRLIGPGEIYWSRPNGDKGGS